MENSKSEAYAKAGVDITAGYRAVELMERLECRWLVRIVESGLELEVYEDELISEF